MMKDLDMWVLAVLSFVVAPISMATGLVLLMTNQITIGLIAIAPGEILFAWLAIETSRSVAITEVAYSKYMSGTFTEQDRQKLAERMGISDSSITTGESTERKST